MSKENNKYRKMALEADELTGLPEQQNTAEAGSAPQHGAAAESDDELSAEKLSEYAREEIAAAQAASGRGHFGIHGKAARKARKAERLHKQEVRRRARHIRSVREPKTAAGRFFYKYLHNFIGVSFLTAFLIVLLTETLARQTVYGGFAFMFMHPLIFLINVLIVFTTIALAMFFKRKLFMFVVLSALWTGFRSRRTISRRGSW